MSSKYPVIWVEIENRGITFHDHAIENLESDDERSDITWDMISETLNDPDELFTGVTGRTEYRKNYPSKGTKNRLNVAVADENDLIVSVHWIT